MAPPTLRIGVMLESVQLSDIMGIDILGNLSAQYYDQVKSFGFPDFSSLAPKMEWYFLSTTLDPAMLTPDMKFLPNMTYDDAPRDLDYLIIGGPLISHRPAAADKFMKEAFPKVKVILTTCIGSIWLASSGVLDGMKATTNRGFLGMAKQMYPGIEWLDQRWVVDGKVWTAGGAQAGIDMIGDYALKHFDETLVRALALEPLDVDPTARGQFYS